MKPKLLVVDDEPGVLDMIRGHFQLRGFDVFTALDGRDGIELCREHRPDVVMLDIKMKHMDGDEALPVMKGIVPAARFFVVSAYEDAATEQRIRGMGIAAYYEKPVSILELQKVVQESLKSSP